MGLTQQDEPRCWDNAADCGQTVPHPPELGDQYAIMAERVEPVAIMRTEERRYRMSDDGRSGLRVARPELGQFLRHGEIVTPDHMPLRGCNMYGGNTESDAGTKGTMFRLVQCHTEMR